MLFDSHAHLNDRAFAQDLEEILQNLPQEGIGYVMNAGCSLASSKEVIAMAQRVPYLFASVGSHPDSCDEVNEDVLEQYRQLCGHEKVKAIGEIGLDYHYEDIPREIQKKAFRMQMELAQEVGLPVIVHEREAHEDGMKIVTEFPQVKGVFHCFSGEKEMAKWLVNRGWMIGFTGVLTFKNARKAIEAAQAIPIEHIVLETDCPYMAPEPYRGKRNYPGYLGRMADKLAEIKGLTRQEVEQITTENAKRLYGID
jgi:TatD DNase family protein